jgi:hypothetical protein
MSHMIECPKCRNKGEATTDSRGAFEVRGQSGGKAVRTCNKCGAGLLIGPFSGGLFGRPAVIPEAQWRRMEEVWKKAFPD